MSKQRILFICGKNKLRSPTAETIFASHPALEVVPAGLDPSAPNTLSGELIEWADVIFVMENNHLNRLRKRYGEYLKGQRVICLDIPDDYKFMDPALVEIFERRIPKLLNLQP